jgi:hypothetical protein
LNEAVPVAPLPSAPKRTKTDENEALSRFVRDVARQLGKEMRADTEYPARARAEGAGGTAQMLLRIDAMANSKRSRLPPPADTKSSTSTRWGRSRAFDCRAYPRSFVPRIYRADSSDVRRAQTVASASCNIQNLS